MPKVTIQRSNQRENKIRQIGIVINGKKAGEIGHDETKVLELPPGKYSIEATIDWCGSNTLEFDLKPGDHRVLFLSGRSLPSPFIPIISSFQALYYITFGRKEFLLLEEK
jgi:hypothetical protein